jgi:hypothetical protein
MKHKTVLVTLPKRYSDLWKLHQQFLQGVHRSHVLVELLTQVHL